MARLPTLFFVLGVSVQSLSFHQTICFPSGKAPADFSIYAEAVQNLNSVTQELFSDGEADCSETSLVSVNEKLHDCFNCSLDLDAWMSSEDARYEALVNINDIVHLGEIGNATSPYTTHITYASADYADVSTFCQDYSYPRVCRSLTAMCESQRGDCTMDSDFLLTFTLDTNSESLSVKMVYEDNRWFGFGFGQNCEIGDAFVYSEPKEYPPQGVAMLREYSVRMADNIETLCGNQSLSVPDSQQDLEIVNNSTDNNMRTIAFTRPFQTNDTDGHDKQFSGSESSVFVFAATGRSGVSNPMRLALHDSKASISATKMLLVPSPEDSDLQWCNASVPGNCTLAMNAITTLAPTDVPTSIPSHNPTAAPIVDDASGITVMSLLDMTIVVAVFCFAL